MFLWFFLWFSFVNPWVPRGPTGSPTGSSGAEVRTCPEPRNDISDFACAVNAETLAEMMGSAATWLSSAVSTCDLGWVQMHRTGGGYRFMQIYKIYYIYIYIFDHIYLYAYMYVYINDHRYHMHLYPFTCHHSRMYLKIFNVYVHTAFKILYIYILSYPYIYIYTGVG